MLEQVELKIQELQKKQTEEYYKKKDADLNAWGLTTKKDGKKSVPIIVTDEEYEALIKASNGVGRSGRNSIAIAFNVISVVIVILGVVGGFVINGFAKELGFIYLSLTILASVLIALIFRGLAEAIRLLQQIVDNRPTVIPEDQKAAYEAEQAAKKAAKAKEPAAQPEPPVVYQQQPVYAAQPQPVYAQQPVYPQQGAYQQGVYPQQPVYPANNAPAQFDADSKK